MTLGIPNHAWETLPKPGDEIRVYSKAGLLVGNGVYADDNTAITIWGNDEFSSQVDGIVSIIIRCIHVCSFL